MSLLLWMLLRSRMRLLLWMLLRSRMSLLLRMRSRMSLLLWFLLRSRMSLFLWFLLRSGMRLLLRFLLRSRMRLLLRLLLRSRMRLLLRFLLRSGMRLLLRFLLRSRMSLLLRLLLRSRTRLLLRFLPRSRMHLGRRTIRQRRTRGCRRAGRNDRSNRLAYRNRFARRQNRRSPMIDCGELLTILRSLLLMLQLRGHRRNALLPQRRLLGCRGAASNATRAVITDAVDGRVVDDGAVVNIVNVGDVDVVYGTVVVELVPVPVAALITQAGVSEPIVNAAVVANVVSPIAVVISVDTDAETPDCEETTCAEARPRRSAAIRAFETS